MISRESVTLQFRKTTATCNKGWLRYFIAAIGLGTGVAGGQQQTMLDYWWIMPEERVENAPRVIRVIGAKGERYEEVYAENQVERLQQDPSIMAARVARQNALRKEAAALMRKLMEDDAEKSRATAYAEAWARVFSRRWLSGNRFEGSSALEDMLTRAAGKDEQSLTAQEEQWLLEALLEDDDRLETPEGRALLEQLVRRLREQGYGSFYSPDAVNDELMKRFADAIGTGQHSMAAYRDAMFKTHRGRVMHHRLLGYHAPWGMGVSRDTNYRQAPQQVSTTLESANTSLPLAPAPQPALPPVIAGELLPNPIPFDQFLATSPETDEEEEKEEEEKDNDTDANTLTSNDSDGSAPATPPMMMMRSMSLRSASAAVMAAADETDTAAVNADFTVTSNASYHVKTMEHGNLNDAVWGEKTKGNSWWTGQVTYEAWTSGTAISSGISLIEVKGGNLYLGSGYTGGVHVTGSATLHAESSETKTGYGLFSSVSAVVPVAGSDVFKYGTLSGSGTLTLSNNAASGTPVIYQFNDAGTSWFTGTVQFGASREGIVQLDLAPQGSATTAWAGVEMDMTALGQATDGYGISTSTAPSRTILNVRGAVTIAGLSGGGETSTVTSESTDDSYTLTLGNDTTDYTYAGTFKGTFYNDAAVVDNSPAGINITKVGSKKQTFSRNMTAALSLHNVKVEAGTLQMADAFVNKAHVTGGMLAAENLTVQGSATVDVTTGGIEEVHIVGDGKLDVTNHLEIADDLYVTGRGTVTAGSMTVNSDLTINSAPEQNTDALTVTGLTNVIGNVNVNNGSFSSGSLEVGGYLAIGDNTAGTNAQVNVVTSNLKAKELRLRADGQLVTNGTVQVTDAQYLHGGASWTLTGTDNKLSGTMNVRGLSDGNILNLSAADASATEGSVVLTLPGVIDFQDTGTGTSYWNTYYKPIFDLDGVTLDFGSNGVTRFRGMGYDVQEGMIITLATSGATKNGWFLKDYPSVIVQGSSQNYHGVLRYATDETYGNVIQIVVDHAIATPFVIKPDGTGFENDESGAAGVVYIEMVADAQGMALPVLAYDDAVYSAPDRDWVVAGNGWSDATPVSSEKLLIFSNIQMENGAKLYMGENKTQETTDNSVKVDYRGSRSFGGNVELVGGGSAEMHGQVGTWGSWNFGGHLGGSGNLKLVAHSGSASSASIFSFSAADKPTDWLKGTLSLADPSGGAVQLNVGNVNIAGKGDTRWKSVAIDMGRDQFSDEVVDQTGTASNVVLAVCGDTSIKGLSGGDANSRVISNLRKISTKVSPVLTLGCDGTDYSYGGIVGGGSFYEGGDFSTTTVEGVDVEENHYTVRTGSISLNKVGSNKQTFTNNVAAEWVDVQEGTLEFAGTNTAIGRMLVRSGATVQTGAGTLTMAGVSLWGNSTWKFAGDIDFSKEPVALMEMGAGSVNIVSSADNTKRSWTSMSQLNMAGTGTWNTEDALFALSDDVTLTLSNTLNITQLQNVTENSSLALFDLGGGSFTLGSQSVMVMDAAGNYYNAGYRYEDGIVWVDIGDMRDNYGIVVDPTVTANTSSKVDAYYWSGVATNGTTIDDVNHYGIEMGHVWRADGSAENTGWHEQRAGTQIPGAYANGTKVVFSDYSVHYYAVDDEAKRDTTSPHRGVEVLGRVAPGEIIVDAKTDAAKIGSGEAEMLFGYAFYATNDSSESRITDYTDVSGKLIKRTSITKTGGSLLILHMHNDFTGGIDVQNGVLYFSRPGAGGTGPITLHNDKTWTDYWDQTYSNSGFVEQERTGVEFMVNYQHSGDVASAYRNPWVSNTILLDGNATGYGYVTISYARAAFDSSDNDYANVPRHWRNLNLTGGVFGKGDLHLRGYTSTYYSRHDQSYVASFSINKSQLNEGLLDALDKTRTDFTGTVTLENTVNWSYIGSDDLSSRTAGSVQLVLQDDVFRKGHINLTREQVSVADGGPENNRQTFANILVVNGDVEVGALSGEFRGTGYFPISGSFDREGNFTTKSLTDISQAEERWRVRTVTGSETTLHLGREDANVTKYVYSGAMGFAQSYTLPQQAHIQVDDGFGLYADAPSNFKNSGSFSTGVERLSLVKTGNTKQYIHSALLNDVSVNKGTLGFNYLKLAGNLTMHDATTLKLGVIGGETDWSRVRGTSYNTTDSVTVSSGKALTIISDAATPAAATIEGNVTMQSGSVLTFMVDGTTPYSLATTETTAGNEDSIIPLLAVTAPLTVTDPLTVTGTLNLQANQAMSLTFNNANFQTGRKYYLASADAITIGGVDNETAFGTRTVNLGYGYFGTLYTVGDNGSSLDISGDVDDITPPETRDYLVMTVTGDPRHTWHGYTSDYDWFHTVKDEALADSSFDRRWKENTAFVNGHVVLFGNLYTPTEWTKTSRLESDKSVQVLVKENGAAVTPQSGVLVENTDEADTYNFNIDGHSVTGMDFQAVKVKGRVAPFIVLINSNYETQEKNGENTITTLNNQEVDATNYYFYTTGTDNGYIDDATPAELTEAKFDGSWDTMLQKTGSGNTVMALDNRYTGGSVLQGSGIMVMQHVNALGHVYDKDRKGRAGENTTEDDDSTFRPYDATITLMGGAGLMGDFDDADFDGNYIGGKVSVGGFMFTTSINNKLVVQSSTASASENDEVDGRLINSYNKKLIINTLIGESDAVLELSGVGLTADQSKELFGEDVDNKYRYGVFKVVDPSQFYGTVKLSGYVWGSNSVSEAGCVQLDIMSTNKSYDGADWTNATVDLTADRAGERTVLGLDITSSGEICEVDSLNGTLAYGASSSVLNISKSYAAVLELEGMRNGDYDGVLGYGDFQVAVNYGGYSNADMGTTKHHYGAEGHGTLDVVKKGDATTQSVARAWLNNLTVEGGVFAVDEALVAHNITAGGTTRVHVGTVANMHSLYSLVVGDGGILAMNTALEETGDKTDAWAGISAGTDLGSSSDSEGAGTAFVRLENGAMLSAREDWFTGRPVDIADGGSVTIDTHNFTIDPYIFTGSDVQDEFIAKRDKSHIIQLLGGLSGSSVTLTVNNKIVNPETNEYYSDASQNEYVKHMGYAALNDLNELTEGSKVNVEAMTVLQILQGNDDVTSDVNITVAGKNATLQILDKQVAYTYNESTGKYTESSLGSMTQYIHSLELGHNATAAGTNPNVSDPLSRENNGQLLLGGSEVKELKPGDDYLTSPKLDNIRAMFSTRHNTTDPEIKGKITNLHVDMSGSAVAMGGTSEQQSEMTNVHLDMTVTGNTVRYANLINSLVHLKEDCSVDISETVFIAKDSAIRGASVTYDETVTNAYGVHPVVGATVDPGTTNPAAGKGADPLHETVEVTTSVNTTVQLTFAGNSNTYQVGDSQVHVLLVDQFQGVDVQGDGITLQLTETMSDFLARGYNADARFIALQIGGGSGRFQFNADNPEAFSRYIDSLYVMVDSNGDQVAGHWVTADYVATNSNVGWVTPYMLYFEVPEPATATLSLLALTALMARRRRKS